MQKILDTFHAEIKGDEIDKADGLAAIVNLQNHVGESVLFSAVRLREVNCTRILIKHADPNLQNIRGDTVSECVSACVCGCV